MDERTAKFYDTAGFRNLSRLPQRLRENDDSEVRYFSAMERL